MSDQGKLPPIQTVAPPLQGYLPASSSNVVIGNSQTLPTLNNTQSYPIAPHAPPSAVRTEAIRTPTSSHQPNESIARPLNVKDALGYLDQVKLQFIGQPEVYNRFLDIMKDFKSQEIDTPGVIERVSNLFRAHPKLITGFNTFLPPGYCLEPTNNPADPVRVTTPNQVPPPPAPVAKPGLVTTVNKVEGPVEINHAINYVNKIKVRFQKQPETYRLFLDILQTYQKYDKPIKDVYNQVQFLFANDLDLLEEFKRFLPDTSGSGPARSSAALSSAPAPKKKRMVPEPSTFYNQVSGSVKKRAKVVKSDKPSSVEEMEFFEKCKRVIGNKTTYNEFLKILNLFSQEVIEVKVLVERAEPFLGKSVELFEWFKRFVKYEQEDIIYNIPSEKVLIDLQKCRQSGQSYRRLPNSIPRPVCSGSDELAKEVLNIDWVGTPVFLSENGFISHKKTPFEEAMFKCEEERYEFDLNIEANLSVIALLEPIARKIQLMSADDRAGFKLDGLGGSKAIYRRVIKKIYDNERGLEVIEALHQSPSIAIPIILLRLKQKDEEWKRSQREWNKVWRDIDSKNFVKALDHQGITFKVQDRKSTNQKYLTTEIELLLQQQSLTKTDLENRYQLDFKFKNKEVFGHATILLKSYLDKSNTIQNTDQIRAYLDDFLPTFFNQNPLIPTEEEDSIMEDSTMDEEVKQSNSMYVNNTIYTFFRLFQMLYSRLAEMKTISDQLEGTQGRSEVKNQVALELGLRKEAAVPLVNANRYNEMLRVIELFVNNEMDLTEFEDVIRELFWTAGYLVSTMDKLVQANVKQLQLLVSDQSCLDLITLHHKTALLPSSPRQETLYRLNSEQLIKNDNIYRIEYYFLENILTIQLLAKDDQLTEETISSEEKWSLYVDQFVQIASSDTRKLPFLTRNLPLNVGEDPPANVLTQSGLELKICVNTYKIFFVDNTEDYFKRVKSPNKTSLLGMPDTEVAANEGKMEMLRKLRLVKLLEGKRGWKRGLNDSQLLVHLQKFESLK